MTTSIHLRRLGNTLFVLGGMLLSVQVAKIVLAFYHHQSLDEVFQSIGLPVPLFLHTGEGLSHDLLRIDEHLDLSFQICWMFMMVAGLGIRWGRLWGKNLTLFISILFLVGWGARTLLLTYALFIDSHEASVLTSLWPHFLCFLVRILFLFWLIHYLSRRVPNRAFQ